MSPSGFWKTQEDSEWEKSDFPEDCVSFSISQTRVGFLFLFNSSILSLNYEAIFTDDKIHMKAVLDLNRARLSDRPKRFNVCVYFWGPCEPFQIYLCSYVSV